MTIAVDLGRKATNKQTMLKSRTDFGIQKNSVEEQSYMGPHFLLQGPFKWISRQHLVAITGSQRVSIS